MHKLCIAIKFRYSLLLIFILTFTTVVYSCSRIKEPQVVSPSRVADNEILGTVSVSIYNTLGIKNEESIERQLESEAQKRYPGSTAITNIRYDKSIAYADVIK